MKLDACAIAPTDWPRMAIQDVCQRVTSGGTPSRKKNQYFEKGSIPWVKTKELDDSFLWDTEERITEEAVANSSAKRLPPGTILLAMYGATVGMLGILGAEMACNQACCALVVNEGFDRDYLFYQLLAHRSQLQGMATGAAQQNLSGQQIKAFVLPFPSLKEQKAIGAFLRTLDDRITLLRETNATLEAIAQALFKSWFVDFDPVRAKQEGRAPDGMDEATAALFPDGFEESELGLVPRWWRTEAVYSLAEFINGASYKAFEPNLERRGLPIVKIAELKAGVTAQTAFSDLDMPEKYRLKAGDILFSWSGNPDTSIDTFVWSHDDALLNQHIFKVVPSGIEDRSFVLPTLKHLKPVFTELARNKQTTGLGHVTVADLKRLQIAKPEPKILAAWCKVIAPILDLAFGVTQQAQTLDTLRDTLLPRLISGQLRLPVAEAVLEANA